MIYNVALVSGVQQSDSVILFCMHVLFLCSFPLWFGRSQGRFEACYWLSSDPAVSSLKMNVPGCAGLTTFQNGLKPVSKFVLQEALCCSSGMGKFFKTYCSQGLCFLLLPLLKCFLPHFLLHLVKNREKGVLSLCFPIY